MLKDLRTFLPFLLLVLLVFGSIVNFYVKSIEYEASIRAKSEQTIKNIGNLISANVETGIRYGLPSIVHSSIEQSQSTKFIKYSFLVDQNDRIFSANKRALQGQTFLALEESELSSYLNTLNRQYVLGFVSKDSSWLVYQIPLSRQSEDNKFAENVERLILVSDVSNELESSTKQLLREVVGWAILSLIISIILWVILKYVVVSPIEELKKLSQSIVEGVLEDGNSSYIMSEFKSLEESLRVSASKIHALENSYQELYDKNPATFITINENYEIVNINEYGLRTLGYEKDEVIGREAKSLYADEDSELFNKYLKDIYSGRNFITHWELKRTTKLGRSFWTRDGARLINQFNKKFILVVSQDISDLHKMSLRLSYQASHDDLTGLINRAEFARLLEMSIEKARLQNLSHCVCFLDLDQFKVINDVCGHTAGDELLKQIADIFKQCLRKDDVLARIGGDEFGLLLESCEPVKAKEIIESIRIELGANRFNWEDKFFEVGISAGISVIDEYTRSIQVALSEADSACYVAKDRGRNRTIVFNESSEETTSLLGEMKWVDKINKSLEEADGFVLYLQKIIPLKSENNLFKGEILIRMMLDGEIIPPGAFLPAAERYNLAYKIDYWVVKNTLEALEKAQKQLPTPWKISINLSAQTVSSVRYNKKISNLLEEYQFLSKHICFEVTETAAMANFSTAVDFMHRLNKLGFDFSLDDFGSGFSSFGYLKKMPVHYLKIDGMFVRELSTSRIDQALVDSMNNIAHALGKSTIAEFVENKESATYLKNIGVDFGQGYFFHKPEPLLELLASDQLTEPRFCN